MTDIEHQIDLRRRMDRFHGFIVPPMGTGAWHRPVRSVPELQDDRRRNARVGLAGSYALRSSMQHVNNEVRLALPDDDVPGEWGCERATLTTRKATRAARPQAGAPAVAAFGSSCGR